MATPSKGQKPGSSSSGGSKKKNNNSSSSSGGGKTNPNSGSSGSSGGKTNPSSGSSGSGGGKTNPNTGSSGSGGSKGSSGSGGSRGSSGSSSSSGSGGSRGSSGSGSRGGSTLNGGVSIGENNPNSPSYRPDRYNPDGSMTDRYRQEYEADENDRIMSEGGWGNGYYDRDSGKTYNADPNYRNDYGYGDPYDDYLEALKDQQDAQARALQKQIEGAVNTLQGYKGTLKDQFTDSASDAYVQNMLSKKNITQQLASQGITGGMAESSNLALETAYGNAFNNLENSYNQGIKDIDRDIFNTRNQGDITKAQNVAQYSQTMAESAYQQAQMQQQAKQAYDQMLLQAQLQREQMELENQYKQQYLAQQQEYKNYSRSGSTGGANPNISRYAETKPSFDALYSNGTNNEQFMKAIQSAYKNGNINEQDAMQFLKDYGLA